MQERLIARTCVALLSGAIVKIGRLLYAERLRGEIIDDGAHCVQATGSGLFVRLVTVKYDQNGEQPITRWGIYYSGPTRDAVSSLIGALTAKQRDELTVALMAAGSRNDRLNGRTSENHGEVLSNGLRTSRTSTLIINA